VIPDLLIRGLGARRSGSGWTAPCPAHDDRNPSLSIREDGGKVLVKCHAGCAQRDVVAALKARGLWETVPESRAWAKRIVVTYDYTDEYGKLLYQIVRFEPKDFRQRYPDGHGGWVWKKHPRQVLYHLPEVLEAAIVFLVEGEKDVETLRERGFVATTCAGGAKAPWLLQFTEALRGREVILLPDADEPGRRRVLTIARALIGKAARIIVLELNGAKDVSEWFEQGHSETYLIAQVEGQEVTR
jgi:putative DNA primase/helicase